MQELINETTLTLELSCIDARRIVLSRAQVQPHGRRRVPPVPGCHWAADDVHSGRRLAQWSRGPKPIVVTHRLKSAKKPKTGGVVSLELFNTLPVSVRVIRVSATGEEQDERVLEGGERCQVQTHPDAVWKFRRGRKQVVGLFITKSAATQSYEIAPPTLGGKAATKIDFENRTPLTVEVVWRGKGTKETSFGHLEPGDALSQPTYERHSWQVREVTSHHLLSELTAGAAAQSHVIGSRMLRAAPSGGPPVSLELVNDSSLVLDVFAIGASAEETIVATLTPGERVTKMTSPGQPWRTRSHLSGREVSAYIPTDAPKQTHRATLKSRPGGSASTLEAVNRTTLSVEVLRVGAKGSGTTVAILGPGDAETIAAKSRGVYLARDVSSAQIVDFIRVGTGAAELEITDEDLAPLASEHPVELSFTNALPFSVDVLRLDDRGAEVPQGHLAPHETLTCASFATHPWRVREAHSQLEVALFLADRRARQAHRLDLRSPPSDRATELELINGSSLEVQAIGVDADGTERVFKTLEPGQRVRMDTFVGRFWLLRDAASGAPVALTRGFAAPQTYTFTGGSLRSHRGEVISATFKNRCAFEIEVHLVKGDLSERRRAVLPPNKSAKLKRARAHQVWRARAVDTGTELGTFIASTEPSQTFEVRDTTCRVRSVFTSALSWPGLDLLLNGSLGCRLAPPGIVMPPVPNVRLQKIAPGLVLTSPDAGWCPDGRNVGVFQGEQYVLYDTKLKRPAKGFKQPKRIGEALPNFPFERVDAVVTRSDGQLLVFRGRQVAIYDVKKSRGSAPKPIKDVLPGVNFSRVAAAVRDVGKKLLLFSGSDFVAFDEKNKKAGSKKKIETLQMRLGALPLAPLTTGEVELYSSTGHGGRSWVLRAASGNLASRGIPRVRSVRVGPKTGATLFQMPGFSSSHDVFSLDTTDVSLPGPPSRLAGSLRVFEILGSERAGIEVSTKLKEDYHERKGKLTKRAAYRTTIDVAPGVTELEVWSNEAVTIECQGRSLRIDAVTSVRLKPNATRQLILTIPADELGVPALQVRTNTMGADERHLVFPDLDVHRKLGALKDDALFDNKKRLGAKSGATQEDLDAVQMALGAISRAAMGLAKGPEERLAVTDAPEAEAWALDLDALGKSEPTFRPIAAEDAMSASARAIDLDAEVAQGLGDGLKKLGNAGKKAGKGIESGAKIVVRSVEKGASGAGDLASDVASAVGDGATRLLEVTIEIGGEAGKFVVDAVKKAGELIVFILDEVKIAIGKLVEWLMDLFGWDDILETHDLIQDVFESGVKSFLAEAPVHARALVSWVEGLGESGVVALGDLHRLLGTEGLLPAKKSKKKESSSSSSVPGLDDMGWLLDKIPTGSSPPLMKVTKSFEEVVDAVTNTARELLGELPSRMMTAIETVVVLLEEAGGRMGSFDVEGAAKCALAAMVEVVRQLADFAVSVAAELVELLFEVARPVFEAVGEMLRKVLPIPAIAKLYGMIAGGRKLTLLSLASLLLAIPLTAGYKAMTGRAPAKDLKVQVAQDLMSPHAAATAYAVTHGVLAFLELLDTAMSEVESRWLAAIGPVIGVVSGAWTQWLGNPCGFSAPENFSGILTAEPSDPDMFATRVWWFQWTFVVIDGLQSGVILFMKDEARKTMDDPLALQRTAVGALHFMAMAALFGVVGGGSEDKRLAGTGNLADTLPNLAAAASVEGVKNTVPGQIITWCVPFAGHALEAIMVGVRVDKGYV